MERLFASLTERKLSPSGIRRCSKPRSAEKSLFVLIYFSSRFRGKLPGIFLEEERVRCRNDQSFEHFSINEKILVIGLRSINVTTKESFYEWKNSRNYKKILHMIFFTPLHTYIFFILNIIFIIFFFLNKFRLNSLYYIGLIIQRIKWLFEVAWRCLGLYIDLSRPFYSPLH